MKKLSILMIAATLFIANSCKKGEEDPFFSLRSRKARITNDWYIAYLLDAMALDSTFDGSQHSDRYNIEIVKNNVTINDNALPAFGEAFNVKLAINNDYTWTRTLQYEVLTIQGIKKEVLDMEYGTWSFLLKNETNKNKERIVLLVDSSSTTIKSTDSFNIVPTETSNSKVIYTTGSRSKVFEITKLSSKEVKMNEVYESQTTLEDDTNQVIYVNNLSTVYILTK